MTNGIRHSGSTPHVALRIFICMCSLLLWSLHEASGQSAAAAPTGVYVAGGTVSAIVVQDDGKIVIGGTFVAIGGVDRFNIARLNADGSVDGTFNPIANGNVAALAIRDGIIYVGGQFTWMAGEPRNGLAAIDAATGTVTPWSPMPASFFGSVAALAVSADGNTVFVGGNFDQIGGMSRLNLAAVATSDGGAIQGWQADVDGGVSTLAVSDGVLYAGGIFQNVAGQPRYGLAALDATTGALQSWDPMDGIYSSVATLAVYGTTVYVSGAFYEVGGQQRSGLAAIDAATGLATAWNPALPMEVVAIARTGNTIYLGGSNYASDSALDLVAVDATSGSLLAWNPRPDAQVLSLFVHGDSILAGGYFTHINGALTGGFARIDDATAVAAVGQLSGQLGTITAIESEPEGTAIVGGTFTAVGGVARTNLARIAATGDVDAEWDPGRDIDGPVTALHVSGNVVYVGGSFQNIGGHFRSGLAAIDRATGSATNWQPQPDGQVVAIATAGSSVYVGGSFQHVGNSARSNLAALNNSNGVALAWNPSPDYIVTSLAAAGTDIYVGGQFGTVSGQPHRFLVAVDATSGVADAWSPQLDNAVVTLGVADGKLYAGGYFQSVDGEARPSAAAFELTDKMLTEWNPIAASYGSSVWAIAASGSTIFIGGQFQTDDGQPAVRVLAVDAETGVALPWIAYLGAAVPYYYTPTVSAIAAGAGGILVGGQFGSIGDAERFDIALLDPPEFIFHNGFE